MIVELFGPPGVGKTTFAAALTQGMREHGYPIEPVVSYRPAEQGAGQGGRQAVAVVRRVIRPVMEALAVARSPAHDGFEVATPAGLIGLLPPRNFTWSIRLHQYLMRLFRSWEAAVAARHAVLFDQAFVQAVASLALLCRAPDWMLVERALDAVPKPDALVLLTAPRSVLAARLTERHQRQGRMERLLELDLPTNLRTIGIIERLHGLLRERKRLVICVDSTGPDTLRDGVARTVASLEARFPLAWAPRQEAPTP